MAEQDINNGLVVVETIGVEKALQMQEYAVEAAHQIGVTGYLEVCDSFGVRLAARVVDKALPLNVRIAEDKIKTVLAFHQSTNIRRYRIEDKHYHEYDFGGMIGSTFEGGVAILKNDVSRSFLGGIAFSGGEPEEDELVGRIAVIRSGFLTDLGPKSPTLETQSDDDIREKYITPIYRQLSPYGSQGH